MWSKKCDSIAVIVFQWHLSSYHCSALLGKRGKQMRRQYPNHPCANGAFNKHGILLASVRFYTDQQLWSTDAWSSTSKLLDSLLLLTDTFPFDVQCKPNNCTWSSIFKSLDSTMLLTPTHLLQTHTANENINKHPHLVLHF